MPIKMVSPSHRTPLWKFWTNEQKLDFLKALFACLAAIFGAFRLFKSEHPDYWTGWCLIIFAIVVLFTELGKYRLARSKTPPQGDLHALDAVVETIRGSLLAVSNGDLANSDLRLCIFVPSPENSEQVEQLIDYIGPARRFGRGRRIPARAGVVGRAIRDGNAHFAAAPDNTSTSDFNLRFGFSRAEVGAMNQKCRSWAAVPIGVGAGTVLAVIYADTSTSKFWGNKNGPKRKILEAAAVSIAKHME